MSRRMPHISRMRARDSHMAGIRRNFHPRCNLFPLPMASAERRRRQRCSPREITRLKTAVVGGRLLIGMAASWPVEPEGSMFGADGLRLCKPRRYCTTTA
uniref:Uncharacterized protein n=1 Tax=Arundo donax TaxID=35708 RepID=A0A0A8Y5P5_ARUDO